MSEVKHTPGPWELGYLDHAGQRVVRQEHIEVCTCWHHSVGSIEREMEANARLIAAAPELLEALKLVVTRCGPKSRDGALARAAIAKAEGRT